MKFIKFIAAAVVALSMVACGDNNATDTPAEKSPFEVSANCEFMQIDVDKAYFIVKLDGVLLDPAELAFFDTANNLVTMGTLEVELDGQKVLVPEWAPTQPETKSFWVAYKSYSNKKEPVTITAVDFALPESPVDAEPENVSFKKRTFFNQHTGAGCGYCPFAKAALYEVAADEEYGDKFINAAIYTFDSKEPMYPSKYGSIATVFGVSSWPTLIYDMKSSFGTGKVHEQNVGFVKQAIDDSQSEAAKAGIAVSIASDSGDTFVARASVKAAVDGEYFVGAWLVEDGIEHSQSNYGCEADIDFNIHNNVLRIADSGNNFYGHSLGAMKAGEIKEKLFTMTLNTTGKNAWVKENCRMIFFVSAKVGNKVIVTNCIGNDVYSESIEFDYE